jgi:hypothetical protein
MNRSIGFPGSENHEQLVIDITKIIDSYIRGNAVFLQMNDGGVFKLTFDNPVILSSIKSDIDRIRNSPEK